MAERTDKQVHETRYGLLETSGTCQSYGEGGINQPDFDARARGALEQYSGGFGGYTHFDKEPKPSDDDTNRRERAKKANKIYRKVCNEAGIDPCFFNNFSAWSDYVKGKMSDAEFDHKTRKALEQTAEKSH